jgi:hypothetical protein
MLPMDFEEEEEMADEINEGAPAHAKASDAKRGVSFEMKISLGALIQIAILLVAITLGYANLGGRIDTETLARQDGVAAIKLELSYERQQELTNQSAMQQQGNVNQQVVTEQIRTLQKEVSSLQQLYSSIAKSITILVTQFAYISNSNPAPQADTQSGRHK